MRDRLRFFLKRLGERLWVKPLLMCLLSIAAVFLARTADFIPLGQFVPDISSDSIETLLSNISTSMLVIATFAVGSMISAYASASNTATPRSFSLVVSDDVSQNALSTFIGTFIFSIVALSVLKNGYYDKAGRFALFALTLTAFAIVVLTFVRWVDRIARLGRLGTTIDKVEAATADALRRRRGAPTMRAVPLTSPPVDGLPVYGDAIGYVQRVDIAALQKYAEHLQARIAVLALPGTFCSPGRVLAQVSADSGDPGEADTRRMAQAFTIGHDRTFDEDPRFGFIVLSEIANRALSPAVNDPGTAIQVIGTCVRLLSFWAAPVAEEDLRPPDYDRVAVPALSERDLFDDAFTAISRSGAGNIEVAVRLQKAFQALAATGHGAVRDAALHHARLSFLRAEHALDLPADLEIVRQVVQSHTDIFRDL